MSAVISVACLIAGVSAVYANPAQAAGPVVADLRADSNRDGQLDLTGSTDDSVEETARAIVLPNLDDDSRRCAPPRKTYPEYPINPKSKEVRAAYAAAEKAKKAGRKPPPIPELPPPTKAQLDAYYKVDEDLNACFDAADEIVNGDTDASDLTQVQIVAQPGLPADASGTLAVSTDRFRVFVQTPAGWQLVTASTRLTFDQLKAGLRLGVEATDIARDVAVWDGTGSLRLTVTSASTPAAAASASDVVQLAVAPLLTHHHNQRAEAMLTMKGGKGFKPQVKFDADLMKAAAKAGVEPVHKLVQEQWQQDQVEPGYVSMPTATGVQAMRLLVRSDQIRFGQRELYQFRGPDVGIVWPGRPEGDSTLDSMGNLETIPPYTHNGRSFPAGRIVLGESAGKFTPVARMRALWAAQGQVAGGLQEPLMLDSGWLKVKHVDEFLSFVPADTARGWKLVLADPMAGVALLKKAQKAGYGSAPVSPVAKSITVDKALKAGPEGQLDFNVFAAKKINENLQRIKAATGLTDDEVVWVPTLNTGQRDKKSGALRMLGALVPDAVNSPMVNGYVFAPKQHGVKVNGRDIFADAVRSSYAQAGMKVAYIDDLNSHHTGDGEVHCGTNTFREMSQSWW